MPLDRTAAVLALSAVSPQGLKPSLWAPQALRSGLGLLTLCPVLGPSWECTLANARGGVGIGHWV